jgi:hypothetical protein
MLDRINKEDRPCYLLGDFNIDLINKQSETFLNTMFSHYFHPRIDRPTRITDSSATLIDNIFTNTHSNLISSGIWLADISDHLPIFMTFPYNHNIVKKQTLPLFTYKRQYTSENIMQFKSRLSMVDWSDVYNEVGADNKYNCFFLKSMNCKMNVSLRSNIN